MNKPQISPQFTIDDIHKIREYHYELTKNMSFAERREFYKQRADEALKEAEKAPIKGVVEEKTA